VANEIIIQRNRVNTLTVDLGFNVTGSTLTSEVRSEPNVDSPLLATWTVAVTDAVTGKLTLTMDDLMAAQIIPDSGYMDIKQMRGGNPYAVFDKPLAVTIQGVVTQ